MSKKKHKYFQDNVYKFIPGKQKNNFILQITPFGLLGFSGLNKDEIFNIQYKSKK